MCGFFISNDQQVSTADLANLKAQIGFRGPDYQSGLIEYKGWKVFHARLTIIGLSDDFSQPFFCESGSLVVFNGEILNFKSLARKYRLRDVGSDTEVLARLLDLEDFDLNELEGFFSFVRIDAAGMMTHCARDRFGVKPLFLFERGGSISVSSEASALSVVFGLEYSKDALDEYKAFRAPIFTGSYFEGVVSVAPGECHISGIYFNALDYFTESYDQYGFAMERLRGALDSAISSRLVSDAPVGLLYSSGVDSNLLNVLTSEKLPKLTGGMPGDVDLEYANNIVGRGPAIVAVPVFRSEFVEKFQEMRSVRKEPLSVPNEVVLAVVSKQWARSGGKVLLSGEAADEFFGGYDRIFSWALEQHRFDLAEFLDRYCYLDGESVSEDIFDRAHDFFEEVSHLSVFEKVRFFFVKAHLPVLFRRLDFALMFSGVEGREPFAATDVFRAALKFSPNDLMRKGRGKRPLRELLGETMGSDFAWAEKVGFPIDVKQIFGNGKTRDRKENYSFWMDENLRNSNC